MFQLTAARRRLGPQPKIFHVVGYVSTHSRPKAAGSALKAKELRPNVSTHSRPKAAGNVACAEQATQIVSTHSRPKAAGLQVPLDIDPLGVSTHSRPKAAGCCTNTRPKPSNRFNSQPPEGGWYLNHFLFNQPSVSTHSRPKAAGNTPQLC